MINASSNLTICTLNDLGISINKFLSQRPWMQLQESRWFNKVKLEKVL